MKNIGWLLGVILLCTVIALYVYYKPKKSYYSSGTAGDAVNTVSHGCGSQNPYIWEMTCRTACPSGLTADSYKVCRCPAGKIASSSQSVSCVDPMQCPVGTQSIMKIANTGYQYCSPLPCSSVGAQEGKMSDALHPGLYCLSYSGWKTMFGTGAPTPCSGTPPTGYQACPSWIPGYGYGSCGACPAGTPAGTPGRICTAPKIISGTSTCVSCPLGQGTRTNDSRTCVKCCNSVKIGFNTLTPAFVNENGVFKCRLSKAQGGYTYYTPVC